MHTNQKLIEDFYSRFAARDAGGMTSCYAEDVEFTDPVFTLRGREVGAMWDMLCKAGKDLVITVSDVHADATQGQARWEACYTFTATGRRVHNRVIATFRFENGRIRSHRDDFSFWRWSAMALGPVGLVLGWSPSLRNRVRRTARHGLEKFIAAHPQYRHPQAMPGAF